MAWHGIDGHDDVVEQFRRALRRRRLASSFLFSGPSGIGKRAFAMVLARALLCSTRPDEAMDPCGECPACAQVLAGTHPDLDMVAKPDDKSDIPLELLIGDLEHRGREGLCHRIGMKPFMGGRKVAVIDDADYLNVAGANCLLKTLEEPPPRSVLILISTSPARQLPTIRSRCQLVRFGPLPTPVVAELLISRRLVADRAEAERLAGASEGSVGRALELAEPGLWAFRDQIHRHLAEPVLDSVRLAGAIAAFVDAAGKEAPARRARLRQVVGMATSFYRQLLRAQSGSPLPDDAEVARFIEHALSHDTSGAEQTAARLDRCLDAAAQIDANALQATLIEAWADDLA